MPAMRFPVLLLTDAQGHHTASLIAGPPATAVGVSPGDALGQIRDFLEWSLRRDGRLPDADFSDPEMFEVRVSVRPEYRLEEGRVFPCDETVAIRVPCVMGRRADGTVSVAAPSADVRYEASSPEAGRRLAVESVTRALQGLSPRELVRRLPAAAAALDEVVVHVPRRERRRREEQPLPVLSSVAEPVGHRRVRGRYSRAFGREDLVEDVAGRLRREKANVLLVGEGGIGKTAVLVDAVRRVERADEAERDDDDALLRQVRHRFWSTSGGRLIAGMKYLGQWQERTEEVVEELGRIDGYLCVENLLDLLSAAGRSAGDGPAAFLRPYLERGELRMVGEATPAELDACRRLLPGFTDLFQIVRVPAFTRAEALAVLDKVASVRLANLRIGFDKGVVETVHRLFARFQPYEAFPGRAAGFLRDLLDRAARAKSAEAAAVTVPMVLAEFVRRTGLPELFLRDDLTLERPAVLSAFESQVIGQPAACRAAADLVVTFKAGLNDPGRPVGVLLFCGPTGVGKTELARAIAAYFFGHGAEAESRLIRLDMSEYAGFGAAERLLTAPDGGAGDLIKRMRRQPFSVVLLDEIEKAAPEVFDVLLGVFDEGRLTDRLGRTTSFRSAVIILTSNLGAGSGGAVGFGKAAPPAYESEALAFFRPEFFNRIDAVVTFDPLSAETIRLVTEKELRGIAAREGFAKAGLRLTWSAEVVAHLSAKGYDRRYGARPLQRTIETLVVAPLARLLAGNPGLRDAEIRLSLADGAVGVEVAL